MNSLIQANNGKNKMSSDYRLLTDIYYDHYKQISSRCENESLRKLYASSVDHADEIAKTYFDVLYNTKEGKSILSKDLINNELIPKLSEWIPSLFEIKITKKEIYDFINLQLAVGKKYIKLNIPSHLLNLGARIIKHEICKKVIDENYTAKDARDTYTQIIMLIDLCLSISYEAYLEDKILNERSSQELQTHVLGSELAEKCQYMLAKLHEWHALFLNSLLTKNKSNFESLLPVKDTEFSIWLSEKATVFFNYTEEIETLNNEIDEIEVLLQNNLNLNHDNPDFITIIDDINNKIQKMTSLFTTLTEHAHSLDSGKDPLTKLYNRRYLDVILSKETQLAINKQQEFFILMVDIDKFKTINDAFGQFTGDRLIEKVANNLHGSVRTNDYVFRYGGDKFLLLLVDTTLERAKALADRLIDDAKNTVITTEDGIRINVSLSVGISESNNSENYKNIISLADKALFEAKANGSGCYSVASSIH
jgi:diguanylate cyclase